MIKPGTVIVEDTEENRQVCRKYCRACPSYRQNSLEKYQPDELFCAGGRSQAPSKKEAGCFCPACELFAKHSLSIGHFCTKG
jgi:ribosomal protein L44E